MVENGVKKLDEIFSQQWWDYTRYERIGNSIREKFEAQPEIKQKIIDCFKSQNNKITYYDFFNHIEFDLQLKLKDWENDSIEGRLDRLGLAYIDYWEFVEFTESYGVQFDEPERPELDTEAILDAKLNVSYKDYKLSKSDYFNGIKTILTNEKAALAKCH
jgi:hypothetical protein